MSAVAGRGAVSSRPASLVFRIFEHLFLFSLFIFPLLFGAVNLWALSLGIAVLCGAFSIYWYKDGLAKREFPWAALDLWIAVYLGFFLVSLCFSKIPYYSWVELYKLMAVLTAFLATRFLCRARQEIYRLSRTFVFLGGLLSIIALLQFVGALPHDWWQPARFVASTYVNHNHFAGLLVLVIPISFGLIMTERDTAKKSFYVFMTALMGIAFIFALSRGALAALSVSMTWMLWMLFRRRLISRIFWPFVILSAVVASAIFVFGTESIEQRLESVRALAAEKDMSFTLRWFTWMGTVPMIKNFLWFGSGPGTFDSLFLQFRPLGFSMRPVYAHNDHLHLLAECGIFAFLSASVLVFTFFRRGLRILLIDDSRLRIGVGSGVMAGSLGFLVHSLVDFNFHIPANWLLLGVAAGLLFSMDEVRYHASEKTSNFLKGVVSFTTAAVLAGAFYFGISDYHLWAARSLMKEGERSSAFRAAEESLRLNPFNPEAHYLKGAARLPGEAPEAAADLDEAIRLNPYEPVYDLLKARKLAPFLEKNSPQDFLRHFKEALKKDPKNPKLAMMVANDILTFGPDNSRSVREAAEAVLENAVKLDPAMAQESFELLWRHDGSIASIFSFHEKLPDSLGGLVAFLEAEGLWKYHRKYHMRLLGLNPDVLKRDGSSELWAKMPVLTLALSDFSHTGKESVNFKELFHTNGILSKEIYVHNPLVRLVLYSKASEALGVYPVLYVKIDGKIVDEYYMDSKTYKNYYTDMELTPGAHVLSLEYVNDLKVKKPSPGDRNIWIQRVSLLERD